MTVPATAPRERTVLLVVHQAGSNPGRVARQLAGRGYALRRLCPNTGCVLPDDVSGYAGAVVFGGPMSANDDRELECIARELGWIERLLHAGTPLLGICLGAQLLARVLGARVAPHPAGAAEIGYYPVHPEPGFEHLFDGPLWAYQWHREGFELPAGAELVARGELFPHQAFRHDRRHYGLQFHPEVTRDIMLRWLNGSGRRLVMPGVRLPEAQRADNLLHDAGVEAWLARFLGHWIT